MTGNQTDPPGAMNGCGYRPFRAPGLPDDVPLQAVVDGVIVEPECEPPWIPSPPNTVLGDSDPDYRINLTVQSSTCSVVCRRWFQASENLTEYQFIFADIAKKSNETIYQRPSCQYLNEGCSTPGPKTLLGMTPFDTTGSPVGGNATPAVFCVPKFRLCKLEVRDTKGEPMVIREVRDNCSEISVPFYWSAWTAMSWEINLIRRSELGLLGVGSPAIPHNQTWPSDLVTSELLVNSITRFYRTSAPVSIRYVFSELSNCSSSSWRSGAQALYRSRLGWSVGAFRHMLSLHIGSSLLYLVWELRSHPFYLIKSLCNCTSAAPISSVPLVKRSTRTADKRFHRCYAYREEAANSTGLYVAFNIRHLGYHDSVCCGVGLFH